MVSAPKEFRLHHIFRPKSWHGLKKKSNFPRRPTLVAINHYISILAEQHEVQERHISRYFALIRTCISRDGAKGQRGIRQKPHTIPSVRLAVPQRREL